MFSHRKALVLVLVFWLLGVFAILAGIFVRRAEARSAEDSREEEIRDMVSRICGEEDLEILVPEDALPVSGEEDSGFPYETSRFPESETDPPENSSGEDTDSSGSPQSAVSGDPSGNAYSLRPYGTIRIPSIDCELPLWDGAGKVELRYGTGRMPLSAEAGSPGNLVIFGHRMKRYGSIFNRLGEVSIGDSILIERNGSTYTYAVDRIETVEPSELSLYIDMEKEGDGGSCRITLITCTPTGVGSHRLVVIGHIV